MLKRFATLLLFLLLLCGCAAQIPESRDSTAPAVTLPTPAPVRFYVPGSPAEIQSSGALRYYPLNGNTISGILPIRDGILLFSTGDTATVLTRLTGTDLQVSETVTLDHPLTPDAVELLDGDRFSYFHPDTRETVLFDLHLEEIARIPPPEDLQGTALLSPDGDRLYYCTGSAVRIREQSSGIDRILRQSAQPEQCVRDLLLNGSVLCIGITGSDGQVQTQYLDTENGKLLYEAEGNPPILSGSSRYYLSGPERLFGTPGEEPQVLLPGAPALDCTFLPHRHWAVTAHTAEDGSTCLSLYDLASGRRTAALSSSLLPVPQQITAAANGPVWLLCRDPDSGMQALYAWDPALSAVEEPDSCLGGYYTEDAPDLDGLASCSQYAQTLSEDYPVQVHIYTDAISTVPQGYTFQPEHRSPVLQRELELLAQRLANYPDAFWEILAAKFGDLHICLVSSISPSSPVGDAAVTGSMLFWQEYTPYIVLSVEQDPARGLYHQLCHLADTVVLTESTAYDRWENHNPGNFTYDYDYVLNQSRDGSLYLQAGQEYFTDPYAMSYPKEDRARIMEYAMADGMAHCFQSPHMQAKLYQLCLGIRDAFGLKAYDQAFLWEQYLKTPLTPAQ